MMHYHGTPITPHAVRAELAGRNFCVRYGRHEDDKWAHDHGQSVMLDNGAYSHWTKGRATNWAGFVTWAKRWLEFPTTWAVMPDVIDGSEADNVQLASWLFNFDREVWSRCAPVWHMHESLEHLKYLTAAHERVCIGSSGRYAKVGSDPWHRRMEAAMNAVCGSGPVPVWLHMLRGMSLSGSQYPFASVDSTDVAQNHAAAPSRNRPAKDAAKMATQWDARQCPGRWEFREHLEMVT